MSKQTLKKEHVQDLSDFTDEVDAEVFSQAELDANPRLAEQVALRNGDDERVALALANRMPDRPAKNAGKPEWVAYCVALGASEESLTAATFHTISGKGTDPTVLGEYEDPAYDLGDLILLADRLGG